MNLGGYFFLAEKDMLLDRMSGVTYESLTAAFHSSFEEFRDWNIGFNSILCWEHHLILHTDFIGKIVAVAANIFKSIKSPTRFATFPDFLDAKELGEDVKARIPIYTDALLIWRAYHR